jgi:hypothetical protein
MGIPIAEFQKVVSHCNGKFNIAPHQVKAYIANIKDQPRSLPCGTQKYSYQWLSYSIIFQDWSFNHTLFQDH